MLMLAIWLNMHETCKSWRDATGTPGKKPVSMAESRPPAGLPPCFELELSGKPEEG